MQFIDASIEFEESEGEKPKWEQKCNRDELKMSIKNSGRHYKPDIPYIYSQIVFNGDLKMENLLETVREHIYKLIPIVL